ncbi:MAG TPA: hypothetical protein VI796_03025 [Candidatus Thermoplasmatota archaeon]|nr:hypothetical protein [Candidatus Thermoplasmatota archaeon]
MTRSLRYGYLTLILLFLLGIFAQAFFAGRIIFGIDTAAADESMHASLGWPLAHMVAPAIFLLAFFVGGGRNFVVTSTAWGVIAFLMPIVATLDEDGPNDWEALHPVMAMVLLTLTLWLSYRAWTMVAEMRGHALKSATPRAA